MCARLIFGPGDSPSQAHFVDECTSKSTSEIRSFTKAQKMKRKLKGTHRCKKLQWWKTCLVNDESWLSLYYWVSIRHKLKVFWFLSFDSCSFSSDIVEVSLISFQEDKIARLEIEGSKVWKGWAGHKGSKYFWFLSFQYCRPGEMPSIKYQGSEKQNLRTLKPRNLRNMHLYF